MPGPQRFPVDLLRYLSHAPNPAAPVTPYREPVPLAARPTPPAEQQPVAIARLAMPLRRPVAPELPPRAHPPPAAAVAPGGQVDRRAVPIVRVVPAILSKLGLSAAEVFLLGSCNGVTTVGDLIEIGAVPAIRVDAMLRRLIAASIVQLSVPDAVPSRHS